MLRGERDVFIFKEGAVIVRSAAGPGLSIVDQYYQMAVWISLAILLLFFKSNDNQLI